MRRVLVLILVAGLLAGYRSEADRLHEHEVACLTGGNTWTTSRSSCGDPDGGDIYLMDADGCIVQRLTDDPRRDGQPAWSLVLEAELQAL